MSDLLPPTDALVLVAVVNKPRDIEIARLLGWYRIPMRSAPKVLVVDYLAFYQTSAFGADKWQIQYIAPVRGHELTTRADLLRDEPDHPHAHHEYYKIQLGPLSPLKHPLLAKTWRRITFFYTMGKYFQNARTINDLILADEERQFLWKALRERANRDQSYHSTDLPEADLDPALLAIILGLKEADGLYEPVQSAEDTSEV